MSESVPQPKSGKKYLIITIIVMAMVILSLLIHILLNNAATPPAANSSASKTATAEAEAEATTPTSSSEAQNIDDAKKLIDGQHRLISDDPMALGNLDADVVVELYSDYQCHYCKDFTEQVLPKIQDLIDDGTLRIEYNSFPVLGDNSVLAAQASHAAAMQGKFWEYHYALYDNFADYTVAGLSSLAQQIGIPDVEKFTADMQSPEVISTVTAEKAKAQSLGFTGTPTFLVGYSYAPGFYDEANFRALVTQELARPR